MTGRPFGRRGLHGVVNGHLRWVEELEVQMNKWIGVSFWPWRPVHGQQTITFQVVCPFGRWAFNRERTTLVRGSFNGWGGTNPTLSAIGNGVYSGTYDLEDTMIGETVE